MGVNLLGYNTLNGLDQEGSIRDRSLVFEDLRIKSWLFDNWCYSGSLESGGDLAS